VSCLRWPSPQR